MKTVKNDKRKFTTYCDQVSRKKNRKKLLKVSENSLDVRMRVRMLLRDLVEVRVRVCIIHLCYRGFDANFELCQGKKKTAQMFVCRGKAMARTPKTRAI